MRCDLRHLPRRRPSVRTTARVAVVAAGLLVLAACNPIQVDSRTGAVTSGATFQAVPTTVTVGGATIPAIDLQFRWCDALEFTNIPAGTPPDTKTSWSLAKRAIVKNAGGTTLFTNTGYPNEPRPTGWSQSETSDNGELDHIIVPTGGVSGALTIQARCTSYVIGGSAPSVTWTFPACTTATRACPLTTEGSFNYGP